MRLRIKFLQLLSCLLLTQTTSARALAFEKRSTETQINRNKDYFIHNNQDKPDFSVNYPEDFPPLMGSHLLITQNHSFYSSQNVDDHGTEFLPNIFGYRLKLTDTIIAVFTILLFIATYLLWRSTGALVRGSDKTAERQLRAYIGIERMFAEHTSDKIFIRYIVVNFGQTPAQKITYQINGSIDEGFGERMFTADNITSCVESVQWPSEKKNVFEIVTPIFTRGSPKSYFQIKADIIIKYTDIFENQRQTTCSHVWISVNPTRALVVRTGAT